MKTIFVCFLLMMMIPAGPAFSQTPEARFLEVNGVVEIKEQEGGASPDWKRAAPGDLVDSNTVVSTGLKSSAVISLGSSRLEVRPLTMLTLRELVMRGNTEETVLYLRTGRVRAVVNPPAGQNVDFTVSAPIVTASVRGTSFEFDGIHLQVDDGRVLLTGANRQKVYVAREQRSYVDETSRNRITPPFEAEAALLRPVLPELNHTGSSAEAPETMIAPKPDSTLIHIGWP
ncbi:MAG: FecR family protein [Treponema sp.]|nr:FecR family protein [Treponema sp.]